MPTVKQIKKRAKRNERCETCGEPLSDLIYEAGVWSPSLDEGCVGGNFCVLAPPAEELEDLDETTP